MSEETQDPQDVAIIDRINIVCDSRLVFTILARRRRARCCDRADWLKDDITPSSSDTDRSRPSDSSLRMRMRFELPIARRMFVSFDCSPSLSGSRAIVPLSPSVLVAVTRPVRRPARQTAHRPAPGHLFTIGISPNHSIVPLIPPFDHVNV